MLVINLFMLHNKHIYVIVVPHICCSKHPTPCTCIFLWCAVRLDPCHDSGTVSKFTVSQWDHTSLRLGIMTMFEPCHHRETTNYGQPSIRGCMTIWSIGVGGGPHLTAAHSARQDMCQDAIHSKTYLTNSCQTSSVYL